MGSPLVSVITVVRNGMPLVERTIDAILSQTYANVEYIVVDGASTRRNGRYCLGGTTPGSIIG